MKRRSFRMRSRWIAAFLVISLFCSLSPTAFAAPSESPSFEGVIFYTSEEASTRSASQSVPNAVVSYEEHTDGSITFYQYKQGVLIEETTTTPGSGIVYRTRYGSGGAISDTIVTKPAGTAVIQPQANNDPYSDLPSTATSRPLGYMHYLLPSSGEAFSIDCYVIDDRHENETYTIYEGAAENLTTFINAFLSVLDLRKIISWDDFVNAVLDYFIDEALITIDPVELIVHTLMTRTVVCNYNNQEIHGDSVSHPNRPHGRLDGTYVFLSIDDSYEIITEGYTVRDWGNPGMGRMMMLQVFGIDAAPSSWTNL